MGIEQLIQAAVVNDAAHNALAFDILDLLPGLIAYVAPDLTCVYVNARHREWFGAASDELVGRNVATVLAGTTASVMIARLGEAMRGNRVQFECTFEIFGKPTLVQASCVPDFAPDGTVRGVVSMISPPSVRNDLRARMIEAQAMFDDAFRAAPIGMALTQPNGCIARVNPALATMLGRASDELLGMDFRTITHPDDIDLDLKLFRQVMAGERDGYRIEKRYIHADGSHVQATLAISVVRDIDGTPLRVVAQIDDVTERRRTERNLVETNATLMLAMGAIRGGFWRIDRVTGGFAISAQLAAFMGLPINATLEEYFAAVPMEDRTSIDLSAIGNGDIECSSCEYRVRTPDGIRWVRSDRALVSAPDGTAREIVGVIADITDQRERLALAEAEAKTDPLTGALNRRGLPRRFSAGLHDRLAVVVIDLDGFKAINDAYGHAVGDAILIEVVRRLRGLGKGRVVRLGGDEFALVTERFTAASIGSITRRVETVLRRRLRIGALDLYVGASVGSAWTDDGTIDIDTLILEADRKLYRAKRNGT